MTDFTKKGLGDAIKTDWTLVLFVLGICAQVYDLWLGFPHLVGLGSILVLIVLSLRYLIISIVDQPRGSIITVGMTISPVLSALMCFPLTF